MGTLKDKIQHEVHLFEPPSLENAFMVARKVESKNTTMTTRNTTSNKYRENDIPSYKPQQMLKPQQIDELK